LHKAINKFNLNTSTQADIEVEGTEYKLSPEKEVALFRIVQEALNNIRRHSQASIARIKVIFGDSTVKIAVLNNGIGFNQEEIMGRLSSGSKLGLLGMRERTQLIDGNFNLYSEPGKGTQISIEVKSD
jgi:signal transduction histidine kinase